MCVFTGDVLVAPEAGVRVVVRTAAAVCVP